MSLSNMTTCITSIVFNPASSVSLLAMFDGLYRQNMGGAARDMPRLG